MLDIFYHKTIRKLVAAFGTLFNNITLIKYSNVDIENSGEYERLKVPLSYANKEKFLYNLFYNETLQKPIQVQLPRMSFEMVGMNYDSNRKLVSVQRNYSANTLNPSKAVANFNPVPYDFQFDLNIYTRNVEDMSQILEQILPYFTPDFTITIKLVDDRGLEIERDVPITLLAVQPNYESGSTGDDVRILQFNLTFNVKSYLWGPGTQSDIIRKAITNIYDTLKLETQTNIVVTVGGVGDFRDEEEVYSGPDYQNANWSGRVLNWSPNTQKLDLYAVVKLQPQIGDTITGLDSGARWDIGVLNKTPIVLSKSVIVPVPNTANVASANVTYNIAISEWPNIS